MRPEADVVVGEDQGGGAHGWVVPSTGSTYPCRIPVQMGRTGHYPRYRTGGATGVRPDRVRAAAGAARGR